MQRYFILVCVLCVLPYFLSLSLSLSPCHSLSRSLLLLLSSFFPFTTSPPARADEEAYCDTFKYVGDTENSKLWAKDLQLVINAAIAKNIALSWYNFLDGNNGNTPGGVADCTGPAAEAMVALAQARAGATAVILGGENMNNIDPNDDHAIGHIGDLIVLQSQRPECRNCSVNATLAFVVDTSASAAELKGNYKQWFVLVAAINASLKNFEGGFLLNTWEQAYNDILHFDSVAALSAFVSASQLAANRVIFDPTHSHDDWQYMLDNLALTVAAVGKNGYVAIIAGECVAPLRQCECECGCECESV